MNTFNLPALPSAAGLPEKLRQLHAELAELAFTLDLRGQAEAADTALLISARLTEVLDPTNISPLPAPAETAPHRIP